MCELNNSEVTVAALYKFVSIENPAEFKERLLQFGKQWKIKGTLILAHEGINGTISGSSEAISEFKKLLFNDPRFQTGVEYKESFYTHPPFVRFKVLIKPEIVTSGIPDLADPTKKVGQYLESKEWNELLKDPEVILIDTRNDYEVSLGAFKGAINPNTNNFREFPSYIKKNFDPKIHKKVAMYCTGGIRCEKSTSMMKSFGFEDVYHLKGGILKYLETTPKGESLWEGECFVFDERVTVDHDLRPGQYDLCHGCRTPLSKEDKLSPHFEEGVTCHHCYNIRSKKQIESARERRLQIHLAKKKNRKHLGVNPRRYYERNRDLSEN